MTSYEVALELISLGIVLLLVALGFALGGCGDNAAPPSPDGGAIGSCCDSPPVACTSGEHRVGDGCVPNADGGVDAAPIACSQAAYYCPVPTCEADNIHCTCTTESGEYFACTGPPAPSCATTCTDGAELHCPAPGNVCTCTIPSGGRFTCIGAP